MRSVCTCVALHADDVKSRLAMYVDENMLCEPRGLLQLELNLLAWDEIKRDVLMGCIHLSSTQVCFSCVLRCCSSHLSRPCGQF
jgi:hypothetical protein